MGGLHFLGHEFDRNASDRIVAVGVTALPVEYPGRDHGKHVAPPVLCDASGTIHGWKG